MREYRWSSPITCRNVSHASGCSRHLPGSWVTNTPWSLGTSSAILRVSQLSATMLLRNPSKIGKNCTFTISHLVRHDAPEEAFADWQELALNHIFCGPQRSGQKGRVAMVELLESGPSESRDFDDSRHILRNGVPGVGVRIRKSVDHDKLPAGHPLD